MSANEPAEVKGAPIKIDKLSKFFGKFVAVKEANLDRKAGEFLTFLGPSGSGKTTTCGKLATMIKNRGRKPMMCAADLQRPAAIEQLKDVGRFSIFTTLVILPGGVVSLLGLEMLARRFGMKGFNLIPSSFRKKRKPDLPANPGK